jgi:Kef-type K+ transport system membrane component KefB/CBS domain-containing protein
MLAASGLLAPPQGTITMLAALLVAAIVGIRIARFSHIPRVVGYLVMGIGLHFALRALMGGEEALGRKLEVTAEYLDAVKSLALCLILFAIGAAFDASHLRAVRHHVWKLSLAEIGVVCGLVLICTWVVSRGTSLPTAVFLAIAAIATAPAATLLVLRQYGAKGPMTEHILVATGMNNLVAIVLFYVAFLVFAELGPDAGGIHAEHMDRGLLVGILLATAGSAAVGFVLGLVLSMGHIVMTRYESLLLFLALMLAVSVGAKAMGMNQLIICMFMGLAFTNFSIQPHQLLADLEPVANPIFALFFVLAGFKLNLGLLLTVGTLGVAFLAARSAGKVLGAYLGVQWIGPRHRVLPNLGTAMLCQAGVAIGLGKYLVEHWGRTVDGAFVPEPQAAAVNTVILASVAVFELTGPLLTKRAVIRAGEVKAVTLLSRPGGSVREVSTIVSRLRRAVESRKTASQQAAEGVLTARHAMRTNIETLQDTAKMAAVLRFVERTRLNHFYVVDAEGHLVGTLNFRDLRNLVFNPVLAQMLTAYDMANTAPPVVMADDPLTSVMDVFHKHDVSSLPVIENQESRRLLGIVEQRDVLRQLHTGEDDEEESEH